MLIRMTGLDNHGSLKGRSIQVSSDTRDIFKIFFEAYIDVFFTMRGKNMDIFFCALLMACVRFKN